MIDPEHRRRVDELCDGALNRDPRERAAFVAAACGGDEALRLEVEALLAHAHTAEVFLAAPIGAVAAEVLGDEHGASLVGRQVGVYRIVSHLGTGGMGEVYRARDTKLGRDVAIKVVPQAFTSDPERRARFEREARMLAALNHPNIGAIYGFEEADGLRGLVLELVDGEILADRIQRGPVPVTEALTIARQVAEALDAAHQSGIVHRDLKPANIKITPAGVVKVLDFGLAKAAIGDLALGPDLSRSPTVTIAGTREGVLLGTPAYMSPEQARGQQVDKRTDIWAFGCVLFELLTGKQSFRGDTLSDAIAAILEREPDWQALPSSTPAKIRDLLRHCLQKDRSLRLRDMGDARIEIEEALAVPATAQPTASLKGAPIEGPATPMSAAGPTRRWALRSGLGLPIVAILAGLAIWILRPTTPSAPVSRSVFTLPAGEQLAGLTQTALALSPDGSRLVYVASRAGMQQLYLRFMDSFEAKPIPGTEGAMGPFFSPDSQSIGFFAEGKLKKISVTGGPAVTLCDALGNQFGATWGSDDTIVFEDRNGGGLGQVSASGGKPQRLTAPDSTKGERVDRWPAFLPGAKALLFNTSNTFANTPGAAMFVALYVRQTGERRNLFQGGVSPRYTTTGHVLYAQEGTLRAVPFHLGRLAVMGTAVPVVDDVMQAAFAQYGFSDNGTLVYVPGGLQGARNMLVWVDRKGAEQPLSAPTRNYGYVRLSPEGRRVAVSSQGQIWIYDLARETLKRLTFEGGNNPAWTPDGTRVVFQSGAPVNLFWQPADGSGKAERLATGEYRQAPSSWSSDGQTLAFVETNPNTRQDLWVLPLSDKKPQPFLKTPANEGAPQFSPDGRWLAYASDDSGRWEIYVQPYRGPAGKWQVSTDGGKEPVWNRNGRELFYRNGNKMMAVDVATRESSFSAGKPNVLFDARYESTNASLPAYDVSPDGERFLMVKAVEQEQSASQINVVLNWFTELQQRVPTR